MDEKQFRHYLENLSGLNLSQFLIAKENDQIKAVLAAWDLSSYRRFVVTRRSSQIQMVNLLFRILSPVIRMPSPIRLNQPLAQKTIILYAHDDCPDALADLVKTTNNDLRGKEYTMLQLFVHEDDPILPHLKGLTKVTIPVDIHVFTDTANLAESLKNDPGQVHLEFPMYI